MSSELGGSQKVNKINLRPSENAGERGRGVSSSAGPVVWPSDYPRESQADDGERGVEARRVGEVRSLFGETKSTTGGSR